MAIETLRSLLLQNGISDMPVRQQRAMGASTGYDAATRGRRGAGWSPSVLGPGSLHSTASETIVARSRDAVRNSGWASSAIDSWVANVIGPGGMRMIHQHSDDDVRAQITKVWDVWCKQCDYEYQAGVPGTGLNDFAGIQQLAAREVWEGGEVFVRLHIRPKSDGLIVPLQLQLLPSEQLPIWQMALSSIKVPDGNVVRSGIEYNARGQRVAYHFYKSHPGETMFLGTDGVTTERTLAKFVLPVFEVLRAGQMRGMPKLTSVLTKLNEIEKLTDGELVRKATCSMITGVITKTGADSPLPADAQSQPDSLTSAVTKIQPGTLLELLPGEGIEMAIPPADTSFSEALITFLKAFCAGAGVPYHQVTGDLRETSYSSIRAGLVEFRLRAEAYQRSVMQKRLLQPIFESFLRAAVMSGALILPGYDQDASEFEQVHWQPAGWPWVDPLKDIQATQLEIQCGLNTRTNAAAERGMDAEQIDRDRSKELAREKSLKLDYATDPKVATPSQASGTTDQIDPVSPENTTDNRRKGAFLQ